MWRSTWKIELEDGHTIKARTLRDEEDARRLFDIRRRLPAGFAPAIARRGVVLLEDWIDGEALTRTPPSRAQAEAAGVLLGELHAMDQVGRLHVRGRESTDRWREETDRGLSAIREAGELDEDGARRIRAALERRDPGRALLGLIHRDFCGENMVIDGSGELRVIDNEYFFVDALALDVAQTWYRWPLSVPLWDAFVSGYAKTAPSEEPIEMLPFWSFVAVIKSASYRLRRAPDRVRVPVGRLRGLIAELTDP